MISIIKHVTLVVSEKHGKQRNRLNQLDEDLWSCRGTNLRHLFHPRIILRVFSWIRAKEELRRISLIQVK